MNFQFATANRIIFGADSCQQLADLINGRRVMLVMGSNPGRHQPILDQLAAAGVAYAVFSVANEPTVRVINAGVTQAREHKSEIVVAIGGGSVIDAGKAIAAITTNAGELLTYLEVVGDGQPLAVDPLPMIAVPTTAGTGAEVTKNAVITVEQQDVKVSLRDNRMLPTVALVDPALTISVPQAVTATTGLDALTQVIEPYVSRLATPLTDALCRDAIPRGAAALRTVCQHPDDLAARTEMMYVSLLGGLALANAKLGAVHGFAGILGGVTGAAHGAICGCLLPHVTEANIKALQANDDTATLARYAEIAAWVTGQANATLDDLVVGLHALVTDLAVPSLGAMGLNEHAIPAVVAGSQRSSSMKGNPITLPPAILTAILQAAF